MAQRLDRGIALQKPTKLSNGWLRIDGRITRTGVFTYRLPDGKMRRELRLPEEVFKADAMQSFALVPVTDEHPPAFLDATNTKDFARGSVAGTLRQDGQFIAGEMLVTDADLIAKLEGGKAREISCGYTCDLEESPGELNGERYDAIQRNIRGNHVAIVERGRAGPEARVRMDAAVCTDMEDAMKRDGSEDQPRDEDGKWSSTGGGGGGSSKPSASLKSPVTSVFQQGFSASELGDKLLASQGLKPIELKSPAAASSRSPPIERGERESYGSVVQSLASAERSYKAKPSRALKLRITMLRATIRELDKKR